LCGRASGRDDPNSLTAVVGERFGPAVAALTWPVRAQQLQRMGRNSAFDHAGNVAIAVWGQLAMHLATPVFLLVPVFAVLAASRSVYSRRGNRFGPGENLDQRPMRLGAPPARRLRHPAQIPASRHLWPVRHAVPFCQCTPTPTVDKSSQPHFPKSDAMMPRASSPRNW